MRISLVIRTLMASYTVIDGRRDSIAICRPGQLDEVTSEWTSLLNACLRHLFHAEESLQKGGSSILKTSGSAWATL